MKVLKTVLALVAPAVTGALAIPSVASAYDCPRGALCAWQHDSYRGDKFVTYGYSGNWPDWIENQDSSWYNNGYSGNYGYAKIYAGNYGLWPQTLCIAPGVLIWHHDGANDRGSSNYWGRNCAW